jgi:hypothetical protein
VAYGEWLAVVAVFQETKVRTGQAITFPVIKTYESLPAVWAQSLVIQPIRMGRLPQLTEVQIIFFAFVGVPSKCSTVARDELGKRA